MEYVKIIQGFCPKGKNPMFEVQHVVFPLVDGQHVDGALRKDEKGNYIIVDGTLVKGFVKKPFKMHVHNEQAYQILDEQAVTMHELNEQVSKTGNAPSIFQQVVEKEQPLVLRGPDDDEIKERIAERFFILKQLVWAAADGNVTGLVVSGPPGVGKSFGVEEALEFGENKIADVMEALTRTTSDEIDPYTPVPTVERKEPIRYRIVGGHMSPMTLYETLYQYKEKRNVLVFDDCDSVLQNEQSLNILKKALDCRPERIIDWGSNALSRSGNNTPDRFTFAGSVIFITNLNFDKPNNKNSPMDAHLKAIMSRVYYVDLTMSTMRDKFLRIEHVCRDFGIIQQLGLDVSEVDEVMQYFEENILNFREVSIRTVQKIATMKRLNAGTWRTMARITTFKNSAQ